MGHHEKPLGNTRFSRGFVCVAAIDFGLLGLFDTFFDTFCLLVCPIEGCHKDIIVIQLAHRKRGENMPQIIPIRDLKKTSALSELCRNAKEPVFVTKNGYGDMVIMSMETYERTMFLNDICRKLDEGERSILAGNVVDAFDSIKATREKYAL